MLPPDNLMPRKLNLTCGSAVRFYFQKVLFDEKTDVPLYCENPRAVRLCSVVDEFGKRAEQGESRRDTAYSPAHRDAVFPNFATKFALNNLDANRNRADDFRSNHAHAGDAHDAGRHHVVCIAKARNSVTGNSAANNSIAGSAADRAGQRRFDFGCAACSVAVYSSA